MMSAQYSQDPCPNPFFSWPSLNQRSQIGSDIMNSETNAARKPTDELISQSMAQLSFQERQEEQEHLHGVASVGPEDPHQIDQLLQDQDDHLERLKQGTVFQEAEAMDPQFTNDRSFRLMFLRGNRYNPKEAAEQMIRFMDTKQQLFGASKLNQQITLKDLNDDDRACVENGSFQMLPSRDSSNRPMMLEVPGLTSYRQLENELRARFYIYMVLLEQKESQIQGVIFISYGVGNYKEKLNGAGFVEQTRLSLAIPVFFAALHLATADLKHYILMSTCFALVPAKTRARFRLHLGSHVECQYQLSTYGIPCSALPFAGSNNDNILLENHLRWYKARFVQDFGENAAAQFPSKLSALSANVPMRNDVVFGRKKLQHEGNRRFRVFVRNMAGKYDESNKTNKRLTREHLIKEIRDAGGKFLIMHEDTAQGFEELSLEDVHGKIAQAFRNYRRPRAMPSKFGTGGELNPNVSNHDNSDKGMPVEPRSDDVLFGRKRNNKGNKRVRELVSEMSTEYDVAPKARKRELTESVVQAIKRSGGRFLRQIQATEQWEEVPDEYARGKISKHFQNSRRAPKKPF
ncbi:unnamed protein product [Cylindrotheca closterium]|uniref:DUF6824 domain-containing protein n=1 Tax=Cylindrotheca closterium TaxID=2856 RepID=A0AAD2FHL2_9STRA|nr:unnamed protein product [Cylindrotheca closterium]